MRKLIKFNTAANVGLILYGIFIGFHLLVIIGIIPMDIIWGGRINSRSELIKFELVSLLILILCTFITLLKVKYINISKLYKFANIGIWFLVVIFLLNTIGNLFAISLFEKLAFTPITALLAFFSLRLALEKENKE